MTAETAALQRLRFAFAVQGPLRYMAVLDMGRLWERLLRRSGLPLAYSQGFNPHARLQFADALPLGYASVCEMVDVYLSEPVPPDLALQRVQAQGPVGLCVTAAADVPLSAPKPQAVMRAAVYQVQVWGDITRSQVETAIAALLARESIPRSRPRKGRQQEYDLRPLIYDLEYKGLSDAGHLLEMRLRCGSQGAGRPEEVVAEFDLPVERISICRTALIWGDEEAS